MRLAIAPGSSGYYRVDQDGNVYTAEHFVVTRDGVLGPKPGQHPYARPDDRYRHYVGPYCRSFWIKTGQHDELTAEFVELEFGGCQTASAHWCPIHGDCLCDEFDDYTLDCPLHSPASDHA